MKNSMLTKLTADQMKARRENLAEMFNDYRLTIWAEQRSEG
jgi:hypothetical protein